MTSKRQNATGRLSQTDGFTFPGHFWSVLGTKLGGVSAFRVVAMSRAVAADVKATGRNRTVITKGRLSQRQAKDRDFFSRVSEATLGTFPGHFWRVLSTKLGGVSAFRVVAMRRAVAGDVKATGRDRTVITKAGKRSFFLGFQKQR